MGLVGTADHGTCLYLTNTAYLFTSDNIMIILSELRYAALSYVPCYDNVIIDIDPCACTQIDIANYNVNLIALSD